MILLKIKFMFNKIFILISIPKFFEEKLKLSHNKSLVNTLLELNKVNYSIMMGNFNNYFVQFENFYFIS